MVELEYSIIILCFVISALISFFSINYAHKTIIKFVKTPKGPQRIHKGDVPRLGGFSIFICIFLMTIINFDDQQNLFFKCFIISVPIFILGILEDFTQSISPKIRLLGSILSASLFILFLKKL